MNIRSLIALTLATTLPATAALAEQSGKDIYTKTCAICHATGIAGAPRYGHAGDWGPRLAGGMARVYNTALKGSPKGMPAKGGVPGYSDAEVKSAVDYMAAAVKGAVAAPKPVAQASPPPEDGIHDPSNDGTHALLAPLTAYAGLPKSLAGNRVNWVQAIETQKINPRWDRADPNAVPVVMDLNIVREVKGSMPDVVYPHKQHTEWLDCSNCHPAIFIPQKGANAISMAAILLGEKCGVCHGKVAFPVSECRLCHSKKKDLARSAQAVAHETK